MLALDLPGGPFTPLRAGLLYVLWVALSFGIATLGDRLLAAWAKRKDEALRAALLHAVRVPLFLWLLLAGLWGEVAFGWAPPEWLPVLAIGVPALFAVTFAHTLVKVALVLIAHEQERKPSFEAQAGILKLLVRIVLYALALAYVMAIAGVTITPILGAFGIGGLAVALALQDTLSNFFAGVYIALDRPLREGDYVELDGTTVKGFVLELGWRSVRIRELSNNVFIVPNSRITMGIVKNYDLPAGWMNAPITVILPREADLAGFERVALATAKEVLASSPGGARGYEPFFRVTQVGDAVQGTVMLRVQHFVDMSLVTHQYLAALHAACAQAGIRLTSAQTVAPPLRAGPTTLPALRR
ncbi:MAG: mechanosensitive ion channel family protein [Halobacteriales archaeon]|nr:mechanosensitive ion channel family protein [Halobacteriales archaeon]